ncbi:MAG: alpha/beta hydrolase [Chitinophagaceae bacterium]|nr:alpha/beta hydrolase [Chitinophagaceae bacterium]
MRIIFIPGLGEDEKVFDPVLPLIEGEKLVLNTWHLHGDTLRGKINAIDMATELIGRYNITPNDLVIGHSMGGLIALYIKQLTGCKIIQVASFTSHDRVIVPVSNHNLIKWAVKYHLFFNPVIRWLVLKLQYNKKPSGPWLNYIFNLLKNGNKNNVINQLTVALTPIKSKQSIEPDLRIHSKDDLIVRPPKEPYVQIPGDHFSILTHPVEAAHAINTFIDNHVKQA